MRDSDGRMGQVGCGDAQVGVAHGGVVADGLGWALGEDPAEVEDDDTVAVLHDEADVVLDEQHRGALVVTQRTDDRANRSASVASRPDAGSSSSSRLGSVDQGPAQLDEAGLADGQAGRRARGRRSMSPQRSSTSSARARRSASRRRRPGTAARSPSTPPPPPRHSVATSRFSSTVSQPNSCTRWKVRRSPARARRWADQRGDVGTVEAHPADGRDGEPRRSRRTGWSCRHRWRR